MDFSTISFTRLPVYSLKKKVLQIFRLFTNSVYSFTRLLAWKRNSEAENFEVASLSSSVYSFTRLLAEKKCSRNFRLFTNFVYSFTCLRAEKNVLPKFLVFEGLLSLSTFKESTEATKRICLLFFLNLLFLFDQLSLWFDHCVVFWFDHVEFWLNQTPPLNPEVWNPMSWVRLLVYPFTRGIF